MFYSQLLLAKRGPLGRLWLAAHGMNKGLNKREIATTDIRQAAGACAAAAGATGVWGPAGGQPAWSMGRPGGCAARLAAGCSTGRPARVRR